MDRASLLEQLSEPQNIARVLRAVGALLILLALAGFLWYVWPSRYYHTSMQGYPVRIHRVTGEAEMLRPSGWRQLPPR